MNVGDRMLLGASVIPYAIDTQHNCLYILLGSERVYPNGARAASSAILEAPERHRRRALRCVRLESFEETSAIISEIPGLENIENVKNVLESKKYTYRITTICDSERYYVTFVKQVPFDASIQRRYAHNMRMLYHVRGRKQKRRCLHPSQREKVVPQHSSRCSHER